MMKTTLGTVAGQAMRPGDPGADRQFAALGDLLLYLGDRGPDLKDVAPTGSG
jgi:hypothetical protein